MEWLIGLALALIVVIGVVIWLRTSSLTHRSGQERGGFEIPVSTAKSEPEPLGDPLPPDEPALPATPSADNPNDDKPASSGDFPKFTVYHPQQLLPDTWSKLLAYVHVASALDAISDDSAQRLQAETTPQGSRTADALLRIKRGAAIRIIPQLPGCICNPPSADILWLKDWHCQEFELLASPDQPGFMADAPVTGRVAFFVESILVCEVPVWTLLATRPQIPAGRDTKRTAATDPYDKIFVSYSHDDNEVVDRLGAAYKAIGMDFLRDVETLRSAEDWNLRLLELIESADIFQLCWSETASRSKYVEQEWRHALKQKRSHFIRPVFWRKPMPKPPEELAAIHFAFMETADK